MTRSTVPSDADIHEERQGEPRSPLIEQAQQEVSRWRKRRRRTLTTSAILFPISFLAGLLLPLLHQNPIGMILALLVFMALMGSLLGMLVGVLMRPLRKNPIHQLWDSEDVSAIGPLAEATVLLLPDMTTKAQEALIRLLPQVQDGAAPALSEYQRACLRGLIRSAPEEPNYRALQQEGIPPAQIEAMRARYQQAGARHRELILGILKLFEQVGSSADLALVAQLAAGEGAARNHENVRNAAIACLPYVSARADQERSYQTYLRASTAPIEAPDVLLRSSTGKAESDPEVLLRATPTEP